MLKHFQELYKLDLTPYISKKPTGHGALDYISWSDMLALLYENGVEKVVYGNILNSDGHSVFLSPIKTCPEVRVFVEIDGDRRELTYPVISGFMSISPEKMNQSQVHNATQRAFVKCVSVNWGIGLNLWQKEEKTAAKAADLPQEVALGEQLRRLANRAFKKLGSAEAVERATKFKQKDIKAYIQECEVIDQLMSALRGVTNDNEQ